MTEATVSAAPEEKVTAGRHFYWMDWLRFLAALMVTLLHTRFQHFPWYSEILIPHKGRWSEVLFFLPRFGNEAVTVFFVLSGFLVGGRCLERILGGKFDAWSYAIDRGTRIWLPLIPTVLITWGVTLLRGDPVNPWHIVAHLASLQNLFVDPLLRNPSLWTLAYEVWFYVLALAVGLVLSKGGDRKKVAGVILATFSIAYFVSLQVEFLFIWGIGALAYFLGRNPRNWRYLFPLAFFVVVFAAMAEMGTEVKSTDVTWLTRFLPPRPYCLMLLGLCVSLALPTLITLEPKRPFMRSLEKRGASLAASSYSLYLIHRPVLVIWGYFDGDAAYYHFDAFSIFMYFVKVASCLLGGWLFYLAFEKQTGLVRRRLQKWRASKQPAPSPA